MPITEEQMTLGVMQKTAITHVCGDCGSLLVVAWDKDANGYILRCRNINHNTITRHRPVSESDKRKQEDWRRTQMIDTKSLMNLTDQQMLARVDMAKFPSKLTEDDKRILAMVARQYGFDPVMGEITVYQGNPYVSIDGRYRKAQETGKLNGVETRPATKKEREEWDIAEGDYFFRAEVQVKDCDYPFVGWGRVRKIEVDKALDSKGADYLPIATNPQRQAEKRAEAMALLKAFHIPLPSIEDIGTDGEAPRREVKAEVVPPKPSVSKDKSLRDPGALKTFGDLCTACHEEWKMMPRDILQECNVLDSKDITDYPGAYRKIAAVRTK